MIIKENGWLEVQNGFVKKREDTIFEVIRIINADVLIHVEFYDRVDIAKAAPKHFQTRGSFNEYAAQTTDYEKAIYFAVHGMYFDDVQTCEDEKEVKLLLMIEKVLTEEEVFDLANF